MAGNNRPLLCKQLKQRTTMPVKKYFRSSQKSDDFMWMGKENIPDRRCPSEKHYKLVTLSQKLKKLLTFKSANYIIHTPLTSKGGTCIERRPSLYIIMLLLVVLLTTYKPNI